MQQRRLRCSPLCTGAIEGVARPEKILLNKVESLDKSYRYNARAGTLDVRNPTRITFGLPEFGQTVALDHFERDVDSMLAFPPSTRPLRDLEAGSWASNAASSSGLSQSIIR